MTDLPERVWVWRNEPGNEVVISVPGLPYPTGAPEYIRKDIADAAVKAERERMKPFADTAQRFHRRMQLLEGFWASKLARTRSELGFWRSAYSRRHKPDENFKTFQTEAFDRGVNAACDAMREDKSLQRYYGDLIERIRAAAIRRGEQP
jgi:hypothetical protein